MRQGTGFFGAPGKGDLELAAEVLGIRMAQQEVRKRLGVRRDVEGFGAADPGDRAARYVPYGIAASFPGRDPDGGVAAHEGGDVCDVDKVKLEILARSDVRDAVGIFLGKFGQGFEL